VKLHTRVEAILPDQGTVELDAGESVPFDHLVVATGANSRRLGVPGEDLEGIFCLRNVSDAVRIRRYVESL
jgi:NADH dehydrogenase FAD-containing subunit